MKEDRVTRMTKTINFIRDNIALVATIVGFISYIAIKQYSINDRVTRIETVVVASPNTETLEYRLKSIENKIDDKADQSQVEEIKASTDRIEDSMQKLLDMMINHLSEGTN